MSPTNTPTRPAGGPLRPHPRNPRYFSDGQRLVYLTGLHDGWEIQDNAYEDHEEIIFDFEGFLDDVAAHHINLMRFWTVEHSLSGEADRFATSPMPYRRVAGSGPARDGLPQFDLDQPEPAYFQRLRSRVQAAGERGIYAVVMLFCGLSDWGAEKINNSIFHPYYQGNNVQGLNADQDGDGRVMEVHTWQGEQHWITQRQRAYVRWCIDELNDLDHVLWEICNECPMHYSQEWQYRMIDYIHETERAAGRKQHPVLLSAGPNGNNNPALFASPADCFAPDRNADEHLYWEHIPPAPADKVVLLDTDHTHGYNLKDHEWVWRAFAAGYNPVYMDRWTAERHDPGREATRRALGDTRRYADRMDLTAATPRPDLASTQHCLANPGREYLIYKPGAAGATFTLGLEAGAYDYEWFAPAQGRVAQAGSIPADGQQAFTAPFGGDAVLYLKAAPSG